MAHKCFSITFLQYPVCLVSSVSPTLYFLPFSLHSGLFPATTDTKPQPLTLHSKPFPNILMCTNTETNGLKLTVLSGD